MNQITPFVHVNPLVRALRVEIPSNPKERAIPFVNSTIAAHTAPSAALQTSRQIQPRLCYDPTAENHELFRKIFAFTILIKMPDGVAKAVANRTFLKDYQRTLLHSKTQFERYEKENKLEEFCVQCLRFDDSDKNKTPLSLFSRYTILQECFRVFSLYSFDGSGDLSMGSRAVAAGDVKPIGINISVLLKAMHWMLPMYFSQAIPSCGLQRENTIAAVREGKVSIIQLIAPFPKGTFSTVYKAYEFVTARFCAVKMRNEFGEVAELEAQERKIKEASEDIHNEITLLQLIEKRWGTEQSWFVKAPSMDLNVEGRVGYVGTLYECSFFDLIAQYNFTTDLAIQFCKQIIEGAHKLDQMGICYTDYKPDNILYEHNNGIPRARIADMGGAVLFSSFSERYFPCITNGYVTPEDISEFKDLLLRFANEKLIRYRKQAIELAKKITIHSLGVTCYNILAATAPYDESGKLISPLLFKAYLGVAGTIEPLVGTLLVMLDKNPETRITMSEAATAWASMPYSGGTGKPPIIGLTPKPAS